MNNPWKSIEAPKSDFNVQRVSATHPLPLYWAKDVRGGYLFIADLPQESAPAKKNLPDLAGIRALLGKGVNCTRLAFSLTDTADWEIFLALCNDLIRASEKAESKSLAVQLILRHLSRWHEFLKRPRSQVWPDHKIKGLIGELLILERPLAARFGWDNAVSFWHGPEGSAQDFIVYDTALEVKCQTGESRPFIQISSIEQLVSQLPRLLLTVHTLAATEKEAEGAFTLNSLADRVRVKLSASASQPTRERFETLLFQAGYVPLEAYDDKFFRLIATRSFEVRDDFPRLMPHTIPEGIERVSYQISLESIAPFETALVLGGDQS
jgi:hypothetical protein